MKEAVLHISTKQLTAANAKATMVSMGVSVLVVREVDPAECSSEAIRARRSYILRVRVLTVKPLTSEYLRGCESDKGWVGVIHSKPKTYSRYANQQPNSDLLHDGPRVLD